MHREVVLDTCLLAPPEPFVLAMAALEQLQLGQVLHMIHRCKPQLLCVELTTSDFVVHVHQAQPTRFHMLIWHQKDVAAKAYALALIDQLNADKSCS